MPPSCRRMQSRGHPRARMGRWAVRSPLGAGRGGAVGGDPMYAFLAGVGSTASVRVQRARREESGRRSLDGPQ
eukprot:6082244-Alexandrium_andersonii.AAC.1